MRWAVPILLVVVLLAGAGYFLITARFVGREVLSGLPEPQAYEGPELVGGYVLARAMRGPESFIEDPTGRRVVPLGGAGRPSVGRIAVAGAYIFGEVVDLETGRSGGFFLVDTATGVAVQVFDEGAWRERVREAIGGDPPALMDADSYPGDESAP